MLEIVSWITFTEHLKYVRNLIYLVSIGTHNTPKERTRAQKKLGYLPTCWRGSFRGHNPGLTQELDPGNQKFLTLSPVVGTYILSIVPTVAALFMVLLRPSGLDTWLNPVQGPP